uniref:Uncharacterized protein n=1 Tax=Tanacetum cinerariifolium TaxID=118510 RepID=A0A6L2MVI4_TANCI|nr:hypothetical protein [Tanacetum cinerariifolium]
MPGIEEDIGRLFINGLVVFDVDARFGIHHWERMKRLAYRGKRATTSVEKIYSDLKITFVDAIKVDLLPFGAVYEGRGEKKRFMRSNKVYKFCDGTLIDVRDELKKKHLNRRWTKRDVTRSEAMLRRIEAVFKDIRQMRRLEVYVGGRLTTKDIR